MKQGKLFISAILVSLITLNLNAVFAQDNAPSQNNVTPSNETQESVPAQDETPAPIPSDSDIQWLWGEVSGVDTQKNEISIKYLDYETDNEKEIKITVEDKTTFENVKSINDIRVNDTISVDYVFSADGRYIAKNISVEKPEAVPDLQKKNTGDIENLTSQAETTP